MRRVSGRIQITSDAKHLVDGVPFGRQLLRRPAADRPAVKIPPRKRARITYKENDDEEDGDDEGFELRMRGERSRLPNDEGSVLALKENGETDVGESSNENDNRQLVVHANFEDDDSEDDENFVPGDEEEEDADEAEGDEVEAQQGPEEPAINTQLIDGEDAIDESDLNDVSDEGMRAKIRKLHSAFPTSPLAVCKYVLNGSGGDVAEAYGTMSLGFQPSKPASAITETSQASLSALKPHSKKRKAPVEEVEAPESIQVDAAETADSLLLEHYDHNGLPPGSISSGKALSIMAEAVQSSPVRRSTPRRSESAVGHKNVKFSLDSWLTNVFTSTPAIDRESLASDSKEESDDFSSHATSSSGTSSSGTSSSDEDSSSSDENVREDAEVSDTSSSGSNSDSDSDSSSDDDAPEEILFKSTSMNTAKSANAEVDDTSSSGSDSDSDSDSSGDEDAPKETSRSNDANNATAVTRLAECTHPKPISRVPVSPGSGTKSTNARNIRRRQANALNRFKEKGILPAGTTVTEFSQLSGVTKDTPPEAALAALEAVRAEMKSAGLNKKTGQAIEKGKEFEARRQALLASLEDGGVEVGPEPSKGSSKAFRAISPEAQELQTPRKSTALTSASEDLRDESNAISTAPKTHRPPPNEAVFRAEVAVAAKTDPLLASVLPSNPRTPSLDADSAAATPIGSVTEPKPPSPAPESTQSSATSSRRIRLDLGAGRRMLFGALGIKAPKSKQDEEKVRSDLMKDVRPILDPKLVLRPSPQDEVGVEDEDSEAWREKITYRAVECCHDGVELSEPPFPFAQRWDPQQQRGWPQNGKNGGKRKKNQREESQYYQDEGHLSKKQKQRKGKHNYAEQQEYLDAPYEPSYEEDSLMEAEQPIQQSNFPSEDIEVEINHQLMNDLDEEQSAQVSQSPEDLAPLPENPSTLANLQNGHAKPGMTIAFKELTVSEETKWQPEISAYRTAVVNAVLDAGELQLTLALRDRTHSEKIYDLETGERIYGKFDMPDQDEEHGEEDDGIRILTFGELVEPKIVQAAPESLDAGINQTDGGTMPKGNSSDSQILSQEQDNEAPEARLSHVTETTLNSDAPDSNSQESIEEFNPESPGPYAQQDHLEPGQAPASPIGQQLSLEAEEQTPKQTVGEDSAEITVVSEDQEPHIPVTHKGKEKGIAKELAVIEKQVGTPAADPNRYLAQISTDARLKISQIIKDAGFRSSVPSSVIKDLRPTGIESPGDAKVFEKLLKDMTDTPSHPPYSPKFHGLDASSPIKKLRPASADRQPSNSLLRAPQSCWQTVDTDAASSPSMQEEDESSWQTIDPQDASSPPVSVPSMRAAEAHPAPASKFKFSKLDIAQEMWEALQPKNRRNGASSSAASPKPSLGLDGTSEKDSTTSIQYPKLSVTSSFTSQVSDHGRQPDPTFDDSVITNGDTPKAPAFETDTLLNQAVDPMTDLEEPELLSHSNSGRQLLDDASSGDEPEPSRKSTINASAAPRSKTREILRGLPPSDDMFPDFREVLSQRSTTKEKTASVRSKPLEVIKTEKSKKKARTEEHSGEEDTMSRSNQGNARSSKRQSSPTTSQTRKSSRRSKIRGPQPQASQSRPSQSQPQIASTQQSMVVDLTLSLSDAEGDKEDVIVSEVDEQPKRFRQYKLAEDDDDDFVDEGAGWVPKKSSSQNPVGSRRRGSAGLMASSQSSLKPSRTRTTARV